MAAAGGVPWARDEVAAEALSAGRWYFGAPTPAQVKDALERAVTAGAFSLRPAGRESR